MNLNKIKNTNHKKKVIASILAGSILVGGKTVLKGNDQIDKSVLKKQTAIEEIVEKNIGFHNEFVDASDNNQVIARAVAYYQLYILDSNKSKRTADAITIEDIMDVIRMMNGELALDENLNPSYKEDDLDRVANILCTISNCDSFPEYGDNIFCTPLAPLLVDGSYAQEKAMKIDENMRKVVKARKEGNKEEFVSTSKEWYMSFKNLVDDINDVRINRSGAYLLFTGYYSKYVSIILEYELNNKILIGVDVEGSTLTTIMSNLNFKVINKREQTLSEELYSLANDYCNEIFEKEKIKM